MQEKPLTAVEISRIKEKLKFGDMQVISDNTGKSWRHVNRVLNAQTEDLEVIEQALMLIESRISKSNNFKNRINSI